MSNIGLITEYNPFHNGHRYHIENAKKISNSQNAIVVMSGDFVQRGSPSFIDKYSRARMAINNGADLVIELPYVYANSSAEFFANGAVKTLDALGICDGICFGCEDDNLDILTFFANILTNEPSTFKEYVIKYVSKGLSFPTARAKALEEYVTNNANLPNISIDINAFLNQPNNILAIEYIKCILKNNLDMKLFPLKRTGEAFHSTNLSSLASASAIRNYFSNVSREAVTLTPPQDSTSATGNYFNNIPSTSYLNEIEQSVPNDVFEFFTKHHNITFPITSEDFKNLIFYKILSLNNTSDIEKYADVSCDLGNRIYKNFNFSIARLDDYIQTIKSKQFTYTRIERSLFHILMELTKEDMTSFLNNDTVFYVNVLAFNENGQKLLKEAREHCKVPIIIKKSDAKNKLSPLGLKMFEYDIKAMRLYNQIAYSKFPLAANYIKDDLKTGVLRI